jgi:glycosyltransferase involved in cell wall biosynthesis
LIGSVGLLWYIKGYDDLIAALPAVLERFPRAAVVLVGSGQDEGKLRTQAETLGVSAHVHFMGWRSDVPRVLQALDIYVQPSLSEGLAISILEAAGARLPIVASDVGGIPEVIESETTGLLTPPHDPPALAEGLMRLLADEGLRAQFGAHARAVVEDRFSTAAMVAGYDAVYRRLLSARSS